MARPQTTRDIEIKDVDFGVIYFGQIATMPALLKGYSVFLEAVEKSGARVEQRYDGAHFYRHPTQAEMQDQLRAAQERWDEGKKYYETIAAVGETEYPYQFNQAKSWAEQEGLQFPPDHDPITAIDVVIRDEEAQR
jgi:hypothetical protein